MVLVAEQESAKVTTRTEWVDPKRAEAWLEYNNCGRPLRSGEVTLKVRDMVEGRWDYTGDPIRFSAPDEDGIAWLIDGQHRLSAIVEAGAKLRFSIVRGLPPRVRNVVDIGRPRTPGDTFAMNGLPYGTTLAATSKLILTGGGRTHYRPTRTELLAVVDEDESVSWVINVVLPKHKDLKKLLTPAVFAYVYWRLNQLDGEACNQFFEALDTLANLPKGHPILALHQRLSRHDRRGGHLNARVIPISYVFQAWNAWRRGEEELQVKVNKNRDGSVVVPEPI